MKKHNAHVHARKMEKARRRQHRLTTREAQDERAQTKRTDKFRAQGLHRIRQASQMILRGAAAAGIDMRPEDITHGQIDSRGGGELRISDRINPADARRAYEMAAQLEREEQAAKKAREAAAAESDTTIVATGTAEAPRWGAKLNGAWLVTASGSRRSWKSPEAAEAALQRAALIEKTGL